MLVSRSSDDAPVLYPNTGLILGDAADFDNIASAPTDIARLIAALRGALQENEQLRRELNDAAAEMELDYPV